jgi:hypothetical protein
MQAYIALVHKDKDSDFGVSFPDFPGVVTAGLDHMFKIDIQSEFCRWLGQAQP